MSHMTSVKDSLLYLFDRPNEPVTFPKGEKQVAFSVPPEYLNERNQQVSNETENRFGESNPNVREIIRVDNIQLPDISIPRQLGRDEPFSVFIPYHRHLAAHLIEVFLRMRNLQDLRAMAVYAYENCNPYLFIYAYSVALLHRNDTKDMNLPPLSEVFPDKFFGGELIKRARVESNVSLTSRIPIEIPMDYTGTDLEIEHRLAYFREDIGINLHHWHWHLIYPNSGPRNIVDKDRRGELFFYMHQQIIARYNFERFSNKLGRVKRMLNVREPIPEAYFPKMDTMVANRNYASRQANTYLKDVDRVREQLKFDLRDLERWEDRIFEMIHTGNYIDENGKKQVLTEHDGINILGNILEATVTSVNQRLYGDLHNMMHMAIGLCHDPDHRHLESFQPIADPSTSMRDPAFYTLHAYVDDIFHEYKYTLPPYTEQMLQYDGVEVSSAEVVSNQGNRNEFTTFWQKDDVNLSKGLDFQPRGNVFVRITHLQHVAFSYSLQVNNRGKVRKGTVRIFLAPKFDERNVPLQFREQKNLFIELDKFTIDMKAGMNQYTRHSDESSITIPFEQTFRELPLGSENNAAFNYCGCGWPQHMLIPKGMGEGMPCELFVMVSNYADDMIDQILSSGGCKDAASFCGLKDKLYPDKRPMGYPFDRLARDGVITTADFIRGLPNMHLINVSIRFINRVDPPPKRG